MDNINGLRGYSKVFVYKSIDDPKLLYVSKSLHFLNKFFINRFNNNISKFTFDGEMMVRLRVYYIQVYHGVYKRIYKNEVKPERIRVKLKKDWGYADPKKRKMGKYKRVIVGWKHAVTIVVDGKTSITFKFPKVTYEGDELKGRGRWSDIKWLRQAVVDYIEQTGYDPKNIEDTFVNRITHEGK